MKKQFQDLIQSSYASPVMQVHPMHCEGILCSSSKNDSFTEDDSWMDFIEQV